MNNSYFDLYVTQLKRYNLTSKEINEGGITYCTLGEWLRRTTQANADIQAIRELCPDLEHKQQNKEQISRYKARLNCIVPSALLSGGIGKDNAYELTGLMLIDIDAADNKWVTDWEQFKRSLFERMNKGKNVLYMGRAVSGLGLVVIIPVAYPDRHEEHFKAVQADFASDYVVKVFGHPIVIDGKSERISSKQCLWYDPQPITNRNATAYMRLIEKPKARRRTASNGKDFDLETWLRANGVDYRITKDNDFGIQYEVRCPWEQYHTTGEGKRAHTLFRYNDGGIGYRCMHNSCSCRTWKDYRKAIEKGV